jgi:hypothetical protein
LESRQVSTVVLPFEVWEKEGSVRGGRWSFGGQSFGLVVLPSVKFAPARTMARLAEFAAAGGKVIVIDRWPSGSVDGRGDAEIQKAVERLVKAPSAALIALPEIGPLLNGIASVSISPGNPRLAVSRRKAPGGEWFFIHNRSLDESWQGSARIRGGRGRAVKLDAWTGRWAALSSISSIEDIRVDLSLYPGELAAIWTSPDAPTAKPDPVFTERSAVKTSWRVKVLDEDGRETKDLGTIANLGDWRRFEGLSQFAGTLRYKAELEIAVPNEGDAVGLDLGRLGEIAELKVNGRNLGFRVAPPFLWDISDVLKPGPNSVEIEVTNTARARWPDPFSHGDAPSGLFGPVALIRGKRGTR